MTIDDRMRQLVRDAIEPMLTARLSDLEERLAARLASVVQPPPADTAPRLLTQKDVAKYLRVAPRTVTRMLAADKLPPPIQVSPGCSRWRKEDIDKRLERGRGS